MTNKTKIGELSPSEIIQACAASMIALLMAVVSFFAIRTLNNVETSVKELSLAVSGLNVTMAQVTTKQDAHSLEVDRLKMDGERLKTEVELLKLRMFHPKNSTN